MPTSLSLTEQLATLGVHLPAWPEEPEEAGATDDWIQRGQAYAEGVRLWRAQLRNAPEYTKGVVDQLLRHLQDTGQLGVWDELVYALIAPEVLGKPNHERWHLCYETINRKNLTPSQKLGAATEMSRLGDNDQLINLLEEVAAYENLSPFKLASLAIEASNHIIKHGPAIAAETWIEDIELSLSLVNMLKEAVSNSSEDDSKASDQAPLLKEDLRNNAKTLLDAARSTKNSLQNKLQKTAFLALGYQKRTSYTHFDDTKNEDEWQKEVYDSALMIAMDLNFEHIVDFGCGSGFKLIKYFSHFDTLGIELEVNLEYLKNKYPARKWIASEIGKGSIPRSDMIICSDVIEHLPDPIAFLDYLSRQDFKILVISTPERELVYEGRPELLMGPPANQAHTMEWNYPEFNRLVRSFFTIEKHWISNANQWTQAIVCKKKDNISGVEKSSQVLSGLLLENVGKPL